MSSGSNLFVRLCGTIRTLQNALGLGQEAHRCLCTVALLLFLSFSVFLFHLFTDVLIKIYLELFFY